MTVKRVLARLKRRCCPNWELDKEILAEREEDKASN
jgi:hypothetical protein